ncbi:hypothetical protein ACQP1U_17280 [Actinomycetota bacterium]
MRPDHDNTPWSARPEPPYSDPRLAAAREWQSATRRRTVGVIAGVALASAAVTAGTMAALGGGGDTTAAPVTATVTQTAADPATSAPTASASAASAVPVSPSESAASTSATSAHPTSTSSTATSSAATSKKPSKSPTTKKSSPTSAKKTAAKALPASANRCSPRVGTGGRTSCSFAGKVRAAAAAKSWGAGASTFRVRATSPVTHKTYTLRCSNGSVTVCKGGAAAVVYLVRPA